MAREYVFTRELTNPGAISALQYACGTAMPSVVKHAHITQRGITTASQISAKIVRKTAAATVTAAVAGDLHKKDPGDAASSAQVGTALTGYNASAEGTDGDELDWQGFDVRNGYFYDPIPEMQDTIPGGGIVALKFGVAPPAGTYECQLVIAEGYP